MADQQAPFGARVEWALTHKRSGETRTFVQTELPIEGEARMLGLVRQIGETLKDKAFDWERLGGMLDRGDLEWDFILQSIHLVEEEGPQFVVDSAAILLGVYPTNEDGSANQSYEADKAFIRGSINTDLWTRMLRTYADQNDYQRMVRPFWERLRPTIILPGDQPSGPGSTTSSTPDTATPDTSSEPSPPAPTAST